jgi:hypothetical protein
MKEHLTPEGWKPCSASERDCQYAEATRLALSTPALSTENAQKISRGDKKSISDFFNKLLKFRGDEPVTALPAPQPAVQVFNELTMSSEGRYQTWSTDHGDAPVLHTFADLTHSAENVQALHDSDPDKEYQLGECGVIAAELYNTNDHVDEFCIIKTEDSPEFGSHQFVRLKDGTYADSLGIWSAEEFTAYWKSIDPDGVIAEWVDPPGEDSSAKNPDIEISNPELYGTLMKLINERFSR